MIDTNENSIIDRINIDKYKSLEYLKNKKPYKRFNKVLLYLLALSFLFLFLPWTQFIHGNGFVTTLSPSHRPQTIHTAIAGRIEKWYVNEGDDVQKGDTILFISEIKEEYFDPNLVQNTQNQVDAKTQSLNSYTGKVGALSKQINAMKSERMLKLEQARNKLLQSEYKIQSDSMDLEAIKTQLIIAETQFTRATVLNKEGLKPVTDLEEKRLKLRDVDAKVITQQNKLLGSRNENINARIEINRIEAEYADKISKAESDQFTALSSQFDTEAQVNKLQNQFVNYKMRNDLYFIIAPQSGKINRALQSGLGETIKEGTPIVSIMPEDFDIAVETFVNPIDLPLVHKGEHVRIWFDGWPTIVFSGWPNLSYGTFGGRIVAVENFISVNGKYRVLIAQDPGDEPWPEQLSVGAGAQTLALLNEVPIWFELWRKLNGFPPNYYLPEAGDSGAKK